MTERFFAFSALTLLVGHISIFFMLQACGLSASIRHV